MPCVRSGFACNECGSAMAVIRTLSKPGIVLRRRKCLKCGCRMTTTERKVGDRDKMTALGAHERIYIAQLLKFAGITAADFSESFTLPIGDQNELKSSR